MRRALLIVGLLALAAAWLGPLPQMARQAFWAHMTMHMGVVAVAAPLIALGVTGGQFDPVRKAPALFAPIPASVMELIVVWAWHAPALHHAARHSAAGLMAEQGAFLLSGLLVWMSACGSDPLRRGNRTAAGIVGLLLTSMHMTLLGALLALSPRPLYVHVPGFAGLTPLQDQHLGGAIMLMIGGISYLLGGLWLTSRLLRDSASQPTVPLPLAYCNSIHPEPFASAHPAHSEAGSKGVSLVGTPGFSTPPLTRLCAESAENVTHPDSCRHHKLNLREQA
jgi:putative membrane protein